MKNIFLIFLAGITLTFKVRAESDDEINRWEQNSCLSEAILCMVKKPAR
jgi:hypothetical protein